MTVGRIAFGPLFNQTLGFENFLRDVETILNSDTKQTNYPPYNLYKRDENNYVIEVAVAGFAKDEIDVWVADGQLVIQAQQKENTGVGVTVNYLHHGLAARSFVKRLRIADTIQVRSANIKDGVLRIELENVVPDEKKPIRIEIGNELKTFEPQLLQENSKHGIQDA